VSPPFLDPANDREDAVPGDPTPLVTPQPFVGEPVPDVGGPGPGARDGVDATAGTASPARARPPDAPAYGMVPARASSSAALLALSSDGARLVATPEPERRTADGYLRMAARILLEGQRQSVRSIGVVSAHEGEGRTAAAVNLAVCLGRAKGRRGRVLLVDGDARRRTLSQMFCGATVADAEGRDMHPRLIGTSLEGVDLMTAPALDDGLTVTAPSAWVETFEELGATYPHIVVDCPPVLDDPEGMVLRECVQQLVLVLRAGRSSRSRVRRTLGATSARVLGVILNGGGAATADAWR
jgi:Mrp family chromosome partitioning ATPase